MRFSRLLLLLIFIVPACNPAKHIPNGSHLLHRNSIILENTQIKKEEVRKFVRQNPNRRILGFYRFHLNMYQFAGRGRETNIKRWMKNTIGEPPVLFDPVLTDGTVRQFELFMHSKGYFNAQIQHQVQFKKNKAFVSYLIRGNQPYTVREVSYRIPDTHLARFVYADTMASLIHAGSRYDADVFQQERNRITRHLKDVGFYEFAREYIFFRVDSALSQRKVDLEVFIDNPFVQRTDQPDNTEAVRHKRFVIDSIFIFPDYSPFEPRPMGADTTRFSYGKKTPGPEYFFIHSKPMKIRPRAITNNILLENGNFYSISDVELTYNYLSRLRNFRFINLHFSKAPPAHPGLASDTIGQMHARVELGRSPANAFTIEAEGLNTSGNLGIASNVVFHNRNIFKGAEIFNLRIKGALEMAGEGSSQEVIQNLPFNTLELGAEASVDFPKLLLPIRMDKISKTARPKSTLLTGINYRQRPDYTRYIYNFSYGFEWSPDSRKRQSLHPLEISSIKVLNDSLLRAKIPDNNPLIMSRFRDHMIAGSKYSYFYSTQQLGRNTDFVYFRGNLEAAGNLLYLISSNTLNRPDPRDSYKLFNIRFAQYVKGDADFRYYQVFDDNNTLVYRLMAGIGVPFGNLDVLPFIKSYYGGGANGIRAWSIYSLGPGSYQDSLDIRFDRYGDIKLEANLEYRFGIYKFWKAALFVDAGNVWFFKENPQFPGGEFNLSHFHKDIAVGAGLGMRLDFDFFILRVDAAFPVRNPAKGNGQWVNSLPGIKDWNINLGIGYPF